LGDVALEYDWDWASAHRELNTAAGLAPHRSGVLLLAALERLAVGQNRDALSLLDAALTADPLDPAIHNTLSWVYGRMGRTAEAVKAGRRVLEISPTYAWGHNDLAVSLVRDNKAAEALVEIQKEPYPMAQLCGLTLVYQALHRTADADATLARLEADHAADAPFFIAGIYAFRGQNDEALEWLDRAFAQRDTNLWHIKGQDFHESLENDPRYKAFLRKMNLPE
jgi:tetratricopeptide (TPR) repeat protein